MLAKENLTLQVGDSKINMGKDQIVLGAKNVKLS
jgi:hypothetical protein